MCKSFKRKFSLKFSWINFVKLSKIFDSIKQNNYTCLLFYYECTYFYLYITCTITFPSVFFIDVFTFLSQIFHTYNRFRISDSSKKFSESYGVSAWFSKILEILKIQTNHRESFRISNCLMRNLARRLHIRWAVKLHWFSADIAGDEPFMKQPAFICINFKTMSRL